MLSSARSAPARLAFWLAVYSALLLAVTVVNMADAGLPQVPAFLTTLPELWALWCMRDWVLTAPATAALTRRTRQAWLVFGFSPLLWLALTLLGRLLPDWPEESFPLRFNVVTILFLFVVTFYFAAAVRDWMTEGAQRLAQARLLKWLGVLTGLQGLMILAALGVLGVLFTQEAGSASSPLGLVALILQGLFIGVGLPLLLAARRVVRQGDPHPEPSGPQEAL
ncbi:hypothetical protein [uncultured Deinococcus sp.]|uniref:hypothetical protein n=1 Tax=uncultured Deinococcus sp. TaxID=158789 RepID=UPI002589C7A5|nr:hypothetical protein [uncultured Deinococcus sp.]